MHFLSLSLSLSLFISFLLLNQLELSTPSTAVHFYHWLAINLAERLVLTAQSKISRISTAQHVSKAPEMGGVYAEKLLIGITPSVKFLLVLFIYLFSLSFFNQNNHAVCVVVLQLRAQCLSMKVRK
jgi:hypothetical protein